MAQWSPDDVAAFQRDGYLLRHGLLPADVVARMNRMVAEDPAIRQSTYGLKDSAGAVTELALWYAPGDDIFGAVARSARVVEGVEAALGGPACFYHGKLTLKRPQVGGAWDWHQDYGYWYRNGYLFPHMASVFIALDAATRENGCLQVLRGSHLMGRVEHGTVGGQTGADLEKVTKAMDVLEHVHVEMAPGDALFFHGNTLHASGANASDRSRNVYLCCYSRADSAPYKSGPNIAHTPIAKVDDDGLAAMAARGADGARQFYKPVMAV